MPKKAKVFSSKLPETVLISVKPCIAVVHCRTAAAENLYLEFQIRGHAKSLAVKHSISLNEPARDSSTNFISWLISNYMKKMVSVSLSLRWPEGRLAYDIPTFNERVVREAILNAVSHRNYQMGGSVFIRQYRDRLVVESPGGFPNGITVDNILDRQSPRNRRVAEILALCGLVERSGQGMNLMYEWSIKEAKQLPDFTGTDENFVKLTLNGLVLDEKMLSLINRIGSERMESFSTGDFLVINALYHEEVIPQNLHQNLKRLEDWGVVEHIGRNKYVLARSLYAAVGKSGVHTRVVGLDRNTNKELLLKHIRDNGDQGTPFKELQQVLPGQSRNQLQVLMRELRKEGRVYAIGKTRGAKWFVTRTDNHRSQSD